MKSRNSTCRGVTIVEVTMALAVTGVLVTAVAQGLIGLRAARSSFQQRALANQEVANLMERVQVVPWSDLIADSSGISSPFNEEVTESERTNTRLPRVQLSREFQQTVRDAELSITVVPVDEPVEAVKISIKIESVDAGGHEVLLASLSAWRYRFEEENE